MKIVVFGADKRVGVWSGDLIVDLERASAANPAVVRPLPSTLLGLIEGGAEALSFASRFNARRGFKSHGTCENNGDLGTDCGRDLFGEQRGLPS